jgi:hypothetical protein
MVGSTLVIPEEMMGRPQIWTREVTEKCSSYTVFISTRFVRSVIVNFKGDNMKYVGSLKHHKNFKEIL